MERPATRSVSHLRLLLWALLALGLLARVGMPCEAMASPHAAGHAPRSASHCAETPASTGKATQAPVGECALCVTLPDAVLPAADGVPYGSIEPAAAGPAGLRGLAGGPVPPPPRTA